MALDGGTYATARAQVGALAAGEISAADLLELHLARHEAINPAINAVIRTNIPAARAHARELDLLARSGELLGPLHGLPMTIKDTFDVDGMPAAAGAPEYAHRPTHVQDAIVVARLKAAGAVIWGKTNTPYLAGDNQTFNPLHGLTRNPWDLDRTPGGSSGGAAAAVATGLTPIEVGSDIGGSLRLPAHFCGIAALKPSWGRVPIAGHVPPAPGSLSVRDLNVAGPLARTVGDLRLALSVLLDQPIHPRRANLKTKRIAVWRQEPGFPLSASCAAALETAAEAASELGAHVSSARPPLHGAALIDLYLQLLLPILATDLPSPLVRAMQMGRPLARALAKGERFSHSKWALYSAATHAQWLKANETRERLKQEMAEFFEKWTVLLCPIAPATAFPHTDRGDAVSRRLPVDGAPTPYLAFHAWIALATICHLPAAVVPMPTGKDGLPAGVQIIGREGADEEVLAIAEALETEIGLALAPPDAPLIAAARQVQAAPRGRKAPRHTKSGLQKPEKKKPRKEKPRRDSARGRKAPKD